MEHLDRACAMASWINLFSSYKVWHLPFFCLDPCLIVVDVCDQQTSFKVSRVKFESWLTEEQVF